MNLNELRAKRADLVRQAREILNAADAENRGLTDEERQKYDGLMVEIDELKEKIEREERLAALEIEVRASVSEPVRPPVGEQRDNGDDEAERRAFFAYLRGEEFDRRALTVGNHGAILPTSIYNRVIEGLKAYGGLRATRATVLPNVVGAVNVPVSNDTNKGHRVNAGDATAVDPSTFQVKELRVYDYTSDVVCVDRRLLEGSPAAIERYIVNLLVDRIAKITNEEFTTGTGSNMPEGILTAAGEGLVGQSATSITAEELIAFFHSVPAQFRANAEWMMHDATLAKVRMLKNPANNEALYNDRDNTLMGRRVVINDDMPEMSAGAKSILFGDFSRYMIADGPNWGVEALNELYKSKGQVGLVLFSAHGGILADTGVAVKYFQNAAS